AVSGPPTATAGQTIQLQYSVANPGVGATNVPSWADELYLSPTPTFDGGTAVLLARVGNPTALGAGESYSMTQSVTLPLGISGGYYVLAFVDARNDVPETDGGNNERTSASFSVALGTYADLEVTRVVAPPTTVSGQVETISWTVKNDGSGRTSGDR